MRMCWTGQRTRHGGTVGRPDDGQHPRWIRWRTCSAVKPIHVKLAGRRAMLSTVVGQGMFAL